jgi:Bacterial lectin
LNRRDRSSFAFCLLAAFAAPSASYAQFNYPGFSSPTHLQLDGSATIVSNSIQLTAANTYATASAFWYTKRVNLDVPFSTTFSYTINPSGGADGLAFVIQNDPNRSAAIGTDGGGLGATGIRKGVAIAFRTYIFNDVEIDSCPRGLPILIGVCVVASVPEPALAGTHTVQIADSGGVLTVYLDGTNILAAPINLIDEVAGSAAYVGITGGDGSGAETALINSWSFSTGPAAFAPVPASIWLALIGLAFTVFCFGFRVQGRGRRAVT